MQFAVLRLHTRLVCPSIYHEFIWTSLDLPNFTSLSLHLLHIPLLSLKFIIHLPSVVLPELKTTERLKQRKESESS